jgi:ABC-2 type transport system permease protein
MNVGTVIGFEVRRTFRSPAFWILALIGPIGMAAIFWLTTSVNDTSVDDPTAAAITFAYTDNSGLVDPGVAQSAGGQAVSDKAAGVALVEARQVDAYIAYPADLTKDPVEVDAWDAGIIESGKYESFAISVLRVSVGQQVGNPAALAVLTGAVATELTTYDAGGVTDGFASVIPPLVFLVAFYLVLLLQANRMLTSTLEEKENRVTEMILTTISPGSLLLGKVVSLIVIGLTQLVVVVIPAVVVLLVLRSRGEAGFLADMAFDPVRMGVGAVLLATGFLMFTSLLVAVGAMVPSVKESSSLFTPVIFLLMAPFFLVNQIMLTPESPLVQGFTFFPLTAPVAALARNALGSLPAWQGLVVAVEVGLTAAAILWVASRIYRFGAIQYDSRVNLKAVFAR